MATVPKSEDEVNVSPTKNTLVNSKLTRVHVQWRAVLSPAQFKVLREKGTERPGTGEYNKHKEAGMTTHRVSCARAGPGS